jgi:hypothetical protein
MQEELQNKGFKLVENCFSNENMCYLPLYEAKMMHQFEHRHATYAEQPLQEIREGYCRELQSDELTDHELVVFPRYWVSETEVEKRASDVNHKWFIGFRDVTRAVDKRTAQFAILPWSGIGHTVSLAFVDTEIELGMICAFLANFNSFTLDFIARQKMGGIHLSYYLVRQLPVLPPDRYTPDLLRFIVPRVMELTYTAWDLQPFADDVWAEAREMGRKGEGERGGTPLQAALLQQWKANQRVVAPTTPPPRPPHPPHTTDFPRPPFTWDDARRSQLRAELDALYAHLYGLSQEELAYILETFPIVKRKDEATYGEYRTKRLVLEAYESPGITETLSY